MKIKIPFLGDGIESANVISILVSIGDSVALDDTLFELETDKATAPVPSPVAGIITSIDVAEGAIVKEGSIVGEIKTNDVPNDEVKDTPNLEKNEQVQSTKTSAPKVTVENLTYEVTGNINDVVTSPSIKKFAHLSGLDLNRINGTGNGGRVTWDDVKNYVSFIQVKAFDASNNDSEKEVKTNATQKKSIDFSKFGSIHKQPLTSLRQKIADHLTNAWQTIPHVTQFGDINITPLMDIRKETNSKLKKSDMKLTVTIFVMKAIAETLKEFPNFNASIQGTELIIKEYIHMGVAVDTDAGLVVPVIKDIDKKSLQETAKELDKLAEKARDKALAVTDIQGASFTLSNLGGLGASHFTPIVNDPEVAILGTGRAKNNVVYDEKTKSLSNQLIMPVALSYDHRVIDGADGARFMAALSNNIENFDKKWVN